MIKANGLEILLNGTFKELISEAARILHALASTAEKELENVGYDEIIQHILIDLSALKELSNNDVIPEQLELEFHEQLEKYKNENSDNPDWIEFNSGNPFTSKDNPIQASLKGFIMDPRIQNEPKKKKGKKWN